MMVYYSVVSILMLTVPTTRGHAYLPSAQGGRRWKSEETMRHLGHLPVKRSV
jgi:hypothetical protein